MHDTSIKAPSPRHFLDHFVQNFSLNNKWQTFVIREEIATVCSCWHWLWVYRYKYRISRFFDTMRILDSTLRPMRKMTLKYYTRYGITYVGDRQLVPKISSSSCTSVQFFVFAPSDSRSLFRHLSSPVTVDSGRPKCVRWSFNLGLCLLILVQKGRENVYCWNVVCSLQGLCFRKLGPKLSYGISSAMLDKKVTFQMLLLRATFRTRVV